MPIGWTLTIVETTIDAKRGIPLAERLVRERLAACANVLPIESIYHWKGRIEREKEVLVTFKTTWWRSGRLIRRLREEHPYEVPYIARIIGEGHGRDYVRWMRDSIKGAR